MRDYENSDTSSFNTYRSGNENPRREGSSRSEWGSPSSVTRRGSTFGTADHYQRNTPGYSAQDFGDQRSQSSSRNQSGDWNQQQERNPYSSNRSQEYRSQEYRNQGRWPQDNRQQQSHFGNHSQDRDWDSHRSGDRRYYENRDRNQSWNRWNEGQRREDQDDFRTYSERSRQASPRGYSSDYGYQNPSNQGRGYNENRYQNRRNDQDYDREDEGFFDRMGNSIRNAWNRFTEEDREDQDRANRYEDRYRESRRSNRRDNDNDAPPYSWGSSSSEDYRW